MKVSLVTGSLSRFGGGVAASVHAFSQSLLNGGVDVGVFGLRDEAWEHDAPDWNGIPTACLDVVGPASVGYAPHAFNRLRASGADIVHTHGIWKHTSRVVTQWAAATKRPYVVSPHGMLDVWALKRSVWKKKIAAYVYENDHLRRAHCLHALCDAEADAIRALGFDNPICVIPNGIGFPKIDDSRAAPWTRTIPEHRRVMLFLGRLHPKKNLLALIEAWPHSIEAPDWTLVIAGWDQGGHEADLRALVAQRGLEQSVHFAGPLFGSDKDAALRRADAVILPSLSEGLPMAILEAWSYGRPVLQTDACNLPEAFEQEAAIRISTAVDSMANDIRTFLALSPENLARIGNNGRRLAEQKFSWDGITEQMRQVYVWLLDGGRRPDCVRVNGKASSNAA